MELFYNIVLRLPVKSILVCTCVCKTWNSFFKSPSFASSHLNHTISSYKESENHPYLLQLCSRPRETETWDSFSLGFDDQELSEFAPLHFPYRYQNGFEAICSCYGLVLLMNENFSSRTLRLVLWNPVIRKSMVIEKQKEHVSLEAAGLAFDSKTGDYKVLTILEEEMEDETPPLRIELYSLKTNSWKRLSKLETSLGWCSNSSMKMVYLNGALHYITSCNWKPRLVILGFDLCDEVLREIKLPECMRSGRGIHFLWTFEESLSVLWIRRVERHSELQIWVMKKYGVEDSWSHLSTVRLDGLPYPSIFNGSLRRKSGHVLMSFSLGRCSISKMVLYDPRSQETKYLGYINEERVYFLGNYVESLILLDKGNDLSNPANTSSAEGTSSIATGLCYVCDDPNEEETVGNSRGAARQNLSSADASGV